MFCSVCKTVTSRSDARFCINCGSSLTRASVGWKSNALPIAGVATAIIFCLFIWIAVFDHHAVTELPTRTSWNVQEEAAEHILVATKTPGYLPFLDGDEVLSIKCDGTDVDIWIDAGTTLDIASSSQSGLHTRISYTPDIGQSSFDELWQEDTRVFLRIAHSPSARKLLSVISNANKITFKVEPVGTLNDNYLTFRVSGLREIVNGKCSF